MDAGVVPKELNVTTMIVATIPVAVAIMSEGVTTMTIVIMAMMIIVTTGVDVGMTRDSDHQKDVLQLCPIDLIENPARFSLEKNRFSTRSRAREQ